MQEEKAKECEGGVLGDSRPVMGVEISDRSAVLISAGECVTQEQSTVHALSWQQWVSQGKSPPIKESSSMILRMNLTGSLIRLVTLGL